MERARYRADTCDDNVSALEQVMHEIDERGDRVISVMWTPKRVPSEGNYEHESGYTVVSERDPDA